MNNNENLTRSQLRKKQKQEQLQLKEEFNVDTSRSKNAKKGNKIDRILNKIIIVLLLLIVILCIFIFNV